MVRQSPCLGKGKKGERFAGPKLSSILSLRVASTALGPAGSGTRRVLWDADVSILIEMV